MAFSSVSRKNCYMMSAGDLQQRYADANQEMSSKRATPGLVIGCYIDTATGTLSFTVNGKEVANKFQVKASFWHCMFFFILFYVPSFIVNGKEMANKFQVNAAFWCFMFFLCYCL